jgi:hypothetical protein
MMSFVSTTATKFPFWKELWNLFAYEKPNAQGYGTFSLMKNPKLQAQAFAVPWCKRKTIMSGGY